VKPPRRRGWQTFSRDVRLLSALGSAGLLAAVLADAFGALGPPATVLRAGEQDVSVSLGWLALATTLQACSDWSYLLAGALHRRLWLRLAIGTVWAVLGPLVIAGMDLAELATRATGWATERVTGWTRRGLALLLIVASLAKEGYLMLSSVTWDSGRRLTSSTQPRQPDRYCELC
jgi:hypothetical protein